MRTHRCVLGLASLLVLAGCGPGLAASGHPADPAATLSPRPVGEAADAGEPFSAGTPATANPSTCVTGGWDCAQTARFDATAQYVRQRPGRLGVLVRDRTSGAVWRTGATTEPMWTGSTIKVAIAATLLERQ